MAIFVLVGSINMYNSYLFITGEYRGRIVKKISHLEMFDNYVKNTPVEEVAPSPVVEETEIPTEVNDDE